MAAEGIELRLTAYDEGEVVYVTWREGVEHERSEFPHELVIVDYATDGEAYGAELIGSAARAADHMLGFARVFGVRGIVLLDEPGERRPERQ